MRKTIYVDVDEEITSIIEKMRIEPATEIFFVVPKDALLIQGVINLKLLKKEAAKLGKKIVLVTSDKHAKKVIKYLGIATREKSSEDFSSSITNENVSFENNDEKEQDLFFEESPDRGREIGSLSFYEQEETDRDFDYEKKVTPEDKKIKRLKKDSVKFSDFSLGKSRKLNIKGGFIADQKEEELNKANKAFRFDKTTNKRKKNNRAIFSKKREEPEREFFDEQKLDNFYAETKRDTNDNFSSAKKRKIKRRPKIIYPVLIFVLIFLASIAGYWFYFELPKLSVNLFPRSEKMETKFDLNVEETKNAGFDSLKGYFSEFKITQTKNYTAGGEKFSSDKGKARGKVKIYNKYSSQDQPLVATTRVLSEEGELFRLTEGVIVPGMKEGEPGVVEADVIADEPGADYNIGPTNFTIEGFKGGPKYEKFEVKSEYEMQGGKDNVENRKVKVITESDIDTARKETIAKLKEALKSKIEKEIGPEMTFVDNSVEKEIVDSSSNYQAGDIAENFQYTVTEKVKVVYFSEEESKNKIKENLNKEAQEGMKIKEIVEIEYLKDIVDFDKKRMELTIRAEGLFQSDINEEQIKKDLHKAGSEKIKEYLSGLEEIDRAVISYDPSWMSGFSVRSENILIKEESGE